MSQADPIWIFNSSRGKFPSGAFSTIELAERWIRKHRLSGVLTEYPVDIGVFDWAVDSGLFKLKEGKEHDADFVGSFTTAAMNHVHFEEGIRVA